MNVAGSYSHTQRAPLCLSVYVTAVALLIAAWVTRNNVPTPVVSIVLVCSGMLTLILATSFHHLTVEDAGDRLEIRFGPLPLFRRSVSYSAITDVTVGRTTFLDGWGIHWTPGHGWVWNLWGFDCVIIRHGGILTVGSDDAENLAEFLKGKMQEFE